MIFSRIVYVAILVGILTGLVLSGLQAISLSPIIFAAESYETEGSPDLQNHAAHAQDDDHVHDPAVWAPEDGFERTAYTLLANLLAATGFAAVLLALMNLFRPGRDLGIGWFQGFIWGLAGYLAVFVGPGIGLPPEIPGVAAGPLEQRQLWWILCAASVSIGLGLFAFAPMKLKALGLLFLVIPFLVGAPHVNGPLFRHPDPAAVDALVALHRQFVISSAAVNLVFWLLLGTACRLAYNRWLRDISPADESA